MMGTRAPHHRLSVFATLSIATLTLIPAGSSLSVEAQVLGQSQSITNLSATPSPLILPGGLQLTSIVNQTPAGAATPNGTVNFYSDGSTLLGTAPVKVLPATQTWMQIPFPGAPITYPIGLASVVLAPGRPPAVVSAQSPNTATLYKASVALYEASPGGTSLNEFTYSNGNQTTTDAIASGYFLLPKSSGVQSFLVHEYFSYQVFDGSTTVDAAGLKLLNPPKQNSNSGCDCASDPESISIDDFDNDGYSDVGFLISSFNESEFVTDPRAGIALNTGATTPGVIKSPIYPPTPASIPVNDSFCPIAVTTGHFTASAGAQLAVLASDNAGACTSTTGPLAIYFFGLNSGNTALVETATPLAFPDANAINLASADLNGDGVSDLIVGERIFNLASDFYSGGIRTAIGNGDGTFKALSALLATPNIPEAFTTNDFNGDGFVDVAYTMLGALGVTFGDGTGALKSNVAYPYSPSIGNAPGGITSADFNLDGLADIVTVPGNSFFASDIIDVNFSTASSQAALSIASKPLPAGTHTLTAAYSGDINFAASTSAGVTEVVTKTVPVITWKPPVATFVYGTLLSSAQLNATASVPGTFIYSPTLQALLPSGTDTVTATFTPTDIFDYANVVSTIQIVVTKAAPVITWDPTVTTLEYGTLLGSAQLNASANVAGAFSYNPGLQALLAPGTDAVTATFVPTDGSNYLGAVLTHQFSVGSPSLSSILPGSVNVGSANTTITATGLGFISGAMVQFNGSALATTYVDQHHVTAIVPSTLLLKPGVATITVIDPGGLAVLGSQPFAVIASSLVATVLAAEATVTAGKQSTVTLTASPYPLAITATAALSFVPLAPITVQDPAVLFANNTTTDVITVVPSTTPTASQFQFQAGSTAGTITITIHLTLADGQDITPTSLVPVTIIVPPGPPVISSPTMTRSATSIQITVIALSSTREVSEARFHFTAVAGKSLKTTDVTVPLTTVFQAWYGSTASDAFGTNFTYTQPFTIDGNATDIANVTITLVNSSGPSAAATVQ
jgi:hypothetical protein